MEKCRNTSTQFIIKRYMFALMILVFTVLGMFWSYYIINLQGEINNMAKLSLENLASDLKGQMGRIDTYMVQLELSNAAFHRLGRREEELAVFDDMNTIQHEFQSQIEICEDLNALFLYSSANNTEYLCYGNFSGMNRTRLQDIKKMLRSYFKARINDNSLEQKKWVYRETDGFYMLYKTIAYQDVYCTAVFDLEDLIQKHSDREDVYNFFLKDGNEIIIGPYVAKEKKYHISDEKFGTANLGIQLNGGGIFSYGGIQIFCLFFGSLGLVGIIVIVWVQINSRGLRHIFQMELDLKNMEIERQENLVKEQKLQMLSLQRQIRPHFYLNCMKNIYAMAENERYEGIKKSILGLSSHLRYIFSVSETETALGRELEHLKNYVELYRSSLSKLILLHVNIPQELMGVQIPAVSLLTFLENSSKYNDDMDGALKISVSARILKSEGKDRIHLVFRDNGRGFSTEILEELNKGGLKPTAAGHVGIYNVAYRFRLLYKDEFYIAFLNDAGAVINMYFPVV